MPAWRVIVTYHTLGYHSTYLTYCTLQGEETRIVKARDMKAKNNSSPLRPEHHRFYHTNYFPNKTFPPPPHDGAGKSIESCLLLTKNSECCYAFATLHCLGSHP